MSISNNMPYVEHYTIDQLHSLVGDYRRTNSYSYWIMSGVCEGKTVVDCGAGSGLCSWLALRGGASRVIACDISTEIWRKCSCRARDDRSHAVIHTAVAGAALRVGHT